MHLGDNGPFDIRVPRILGQQLMVYHKRLVVRIKKQGILDQAVKICGYNKIAPAPIRQHQGQRMVAKSRVPVGHNFFKIVVAISVIGEKPELIQVKIVVAWQGRSGFFRLLPGLSYFLKFILQVLLQRLCDLTDLVQPRRFLHLLHPLGLQARACGDPG